MEFSTIDHWDKDWWLKAERVYFEAFPEYGRKNRKLIRSMFDRQMCFLHVAVDNSVVIAMALTGILKSANSLLIDYLAVQEDHRGRGIGRSFLDYIKKWALSVKQLSGVILEIESEATPANLSRRQFWEKNGFTLTGYIHQYIWVPEPYQAMYLKLQPSSEMPLDGETLFRHITHFHKKAYTGK